MSQPKRYRPVLVSKNRVEMHQCVSGDWTSLTEYYTLHDRLAIAEAKVAWLQKADRLVIWTGTEWQVRHELNGETRVAE